MPGVDVRRAGMRATSKVGWLDSNHSFNFGPHHTAGNSHHGLLVVSNDDIVAAGSGFDTHPHRDMEIVTWVMSGSLVHQDSSGHSGVIYPGLAQRMSAGAGIRHSERNDSWRLLGGDIHQQPVHFIQMWVVPDESGVTPGYEQQEIPAGDLAGALIPVASGLPAYADHAAIRIQNRHAALLAGRLSPGDAVELPHAPFIHLFIASGDVVLEGAGLLSAGDAVRLTGVGGQRVSAHSSAEILVWEMHATLALT